MAWLAMAFYECATRLTRALVALTIMSGAAVAVGSAAEADPFIAVYMHRIQPDNGTCEVRVGVDINMSEADARSFLAHPGQEATAKLWADDAVFDNAIGPIGVDDKGGWPTAHAGGYSIEYVRELPARRSTKTRAGASSARSWRAVALRPVGGRQQGQGTHSRWKGTAEDVDRRVANPGRAAPAPVVAPH